jgi:hypothetical protein
LGGGSPHGGVFWDKSPTSLKLQKELSSKIRATAGVFPSNAEDIWMAMDLTLAFTGAQNLFSNTGPPGEKTPSSPKAKSSGSSINGPTPSDELKRFGLKRHVSLDNAFASNTGTPEAGQTQKKAKWKHWSNQTDDVGGTPSTLPGVGDQGSSKLSDILSKAQSLFGSPRRPSIAQTGSAVKPAGRSPFGRSASTSCIDVQKSPLGAHSPPKLKLAVDPLDAEFDVDLEFAFADLEEGLGSHIESQPPVPKVGCARIFGLLHLESDDGMCSVWSEISAVRRT